MYDVSAEEYSRSGNFGKTPPDIREVKVRVTVRLRVRREETERNDNAE